MDDDVWKALADPTRRDIVDFLAERPRTTGDIVERFGDLCRTGVMKHMDILERAGLLLVRRDGRTRWNHFNPVPIQRIHDRWVARHVTQVASSLSRLKDLVEADPQPTEPRNPSWKQPHSNRRASRATSSKSSSKRRPRASGKH